LSVESDAVGLKQIREKTIEKRVERRREVKLWSRRGEK
jgi:hypothetical protein